MAASEEINITLVSITLCVAILIVILQCIMMYCMHKKFYHEVDTEKAGKKIALETDKEEKEEIDKKEKIEK